jgi:hypothetical protein
MCVCVCVCIMCVCLCVCVYLIQADVMILRILFIILRNLLRAFPDFNDMLTFSHILAYADVQDDVMSKIRKSSGANYDLRSNAQVPQHTSATCLASAGTVSLFLFFCAQLELTSSAL